MDDTKNLLVDFTFSTEIEAPAASAIAAGVHHLGKCSCGSDQFVLANEMTADAIKGVRASRMYECMGCGMYRLG
jgi:hypothetical protein